MKITDAFWDERSTGLRTCEIVFDRGDSFQEYLDSGVEKRFEYSVVKIPAGDLKLVHQLEDIGYRYLENQLLLSFEVSQLDDMNPRWIRLLEGFSCKQLTTKDEIDLVLNEVNQNMFETDRYSLDPFWKAGTSSKRYANWINDLFVKGVTRFYVIVQEGKERGFFTMNQVSENIQSCPIAGIYNKYKSAGYIFVLTWFWLLKSKETGSTKLITSVSSNNRNILSSLSRIFTFRINDVYIVLRKVS